MDSRVEEKHAIDDDIFPEKEQVCNFEVYLHHLLLDLQMVGMMNSIMQLWLLYQPRSFLNLPDLVTIIHASLQPTLITTMCCTGMTTLDKCF